MLDLIAIIVNILVGYAIFTLTIGNQGETTHAETKARRTAARRTARQPKASAASGQGLAVQDTTPPYIEEWHFFGSIREAEQLAKDGATVYLGTMEGRQLDLEHIDTLLGGNRVYVDASNKIYTSYDMVQIYAFVPLAVGQMYHLPTTWVSYAQQPEGKWF